MKSLVFIDQKASSRYVLEKSDDFVNGGDWMESLNVRRGDRMNKLEDAMRVLRREVKTNANTGIKYRLRDRHSVTLIYDNR